MRLFAVIALIILSMALAQDGGSQPSAGGGEAQSAENTQATCPTGGIGGILPIVAMVAIFYFLIIRPQQKQQKRLKEMRENLQKGDRVITSGGIHGVVVNLKGGKITVKIADGVKVEVARDSLTLDSTEQMETG